MKKILFLLLALMLSAFSAAAQPTANGTDLKLPDISYAALNKELDKTVAALNDGKTSVEQSSAILDRLEEIQGQINQTLPAFLTAQDNLQKKIAALGDVPADGKEPAAIAKKLFLFIRHKILIVNKLIDKISLIIGQHTMVSALKVKHKKTPGTIRYRAFKTVKPSF